MACDQTKQPHQAQRTSLASSSPCPSSFLSICLQQQTQKTPRLKSMQLKKENSPR